MTSLTWDLATIADITGGHAVGAASVSSVSTDSRDIQPGALFVALIGDTHDGHAHVEAAMSAGAGACLVAKGRLPGGVPGVEVDDTLAALAALAGRRRDAITIPVVGITGSSGKTTTKDLTAAALGPGAHAAPASFNNEVGLPLTLLATPSEATVVVAEVGSRGLGHIAALGKVLRPDIAVITNVGPAHLEMFGDLDTVARAKWELVAALPSDGIAVLPDDLADAGPVPGAVVRFGTGPAADVRAEDIEVDGEGRVSMVIAHAGERVPLRLPVAGTHQASNAAAAAAVAVALGTPLAEAAAGIAGAGVSPWRMEVSHLTVTGGAVTLVNDAYNANPASMAAALETVAAMPGRKVAVLGRMHELGDGEGAFHRDVGALAGRLGFDTVLVVGDDPGIAEGAGGRAVTVSDAAAAVDALCRIIQPGDVVLVKASRATGLEHVTAALAEGVAA